MRARPTVWDSRWAAGWVILWAATGCSFDPVESSEVTSGEIYASIGVVSYVTDGTIYALAKFREDDELGRFISLSAGDEVSVTPADGETIVLEAGSPDTGVGFFDNYVGYSTEVPGMGGDEYVFSLTRVDAANAPNTTVSLPSPFDVDSLEGQTFSRAEPVDITWSPSGSSDSVFIRIVGSCFESVDIDDVPDTGRFTLDAGRLVPRGEDDSCDMLVEVEKVRLGTLDPAFRAGEADGTQERRAKATSTP